MVVLAMIKSRDRDMNKIFNYLLGLPTSEDEQSHPHIQHYYTSQPGNQPRPVRLWSHKRRKTSCAMKISMSDQTLLAAMYNVRLLQLLSPNEFQMMIFHFIKTSTA